MEDLVVEPLCLRYKGKDGLAEFEKYLTDSSSARPLVIRRPEDILLSLDGLVQQCYRFTPWGMWSLCHRLSPGLAGVIGDFSGNALERNIKGRTDIRAAVSVLNTAIRLRFNDSLLGCRMIVDQLRRTIDGVVGAKYEFLGNQDLFTNSQEFVKSVDGEFLSAAISGRRMLLRYVANRPWFTVTPLESSGYDWSRYGVSAGRYRMGWSFSNSETGQSSVRAGLLIVDCAGNASQRSLLKRKHTKGLRNSGSNWLMGEVERATSSINLDTLVRSMQRLHRNAFPQAPGALGASRSAELMAKGLGKRMPRPAALQAAREFYEPSEAMSSPFSPVLPSRLWYSLYESLTAMSSEYPIQDQEKIECLAYDFMRGRFHPFVDEKQLQKVEVEK